MDTEFCAPGFATDRVFKQEEAGACDASLDFFIATAVIICAGRFLGFAVRAYVFWEKRQRRDDGGPREQNRHRVQLPVGAILDFASFALYTLVFTLVGTNVANANNGISLAINSISFMPFAIGFSLFLFRLVRLGSKITPLLKSRLVAGDQDELSTFSSFGKLLGVIQLASLLISCLVLIIFAPIFPQHDHLFAQIGFAFKGAYLGTTGLGIAYQIQRCINVIYMVSKSSKSYNRSDESQTPTKAMKDKNLAKAIGKLRYNQFLVAWIALPICVLVICFVCEAMIWNWYWILLFTCGGEMIGNLAVVLQQFQRLRRQRGKQEQQQNKRRIQDEGLVSSPSFISPKATRTTALGVTAGGGGNIESHHSSSHQSRV